jgi:hypothetical protein
MESELLTGEEERGGLNRTGNGRGERILGVVGQIYVEEVLDTSDSEKSHDDKESVEEALDTFESEKLHDGKDDVSESLLPLITSLK